MSGDALRCVIDTNVATTANAANAEAPAGCIVASARALQSVMESGHVFIDAGGSIVTEYRANLNAQGQPGPGDAFLRWLLREEWSGRYVTRVPITPSDDDDQGFAELPKPPPGVHYDRSDRKFLAVAAAHVERPVILQSFDSKWWGWRDALEAAGVSVMFLCEDAIKQKHDEKMRA